MLRSPVCFVPSDRRRFIEVGLFGSKADLSSDNEVFVGFADLGDDSFECVYDRHAEFAVFLVLGNVCACYRHWLHGRCSLLENLNSLRGLTPRPEKLSFLNAPRRYPTLSSPIPKTGQKSF